MWNTCWQSLVLSILLVGFEWRSKVGLYNNSLGRSSDKHTSLAERSDARKLVWAAVLVHKRVLTSEVKSKDEVIDDVQIPTSIERCVTTIPDLA